MALGADELAWIDAVGQAELIARGEVSAAEVVDAAIRRIEQLDPQLGALVDTRFDAARAEADGALPDGPLRGVPFLLKDAVQHSAGDRYQHGMAFLRDHPWRSPHDTELTRRYRAAGLVLLGRTKVPELTISPTTEPLAHGPAHNPWAPDRSPGGSSGGSGAAVAAGMVPLAHGNDMGGSIRIPASCCGLVGLKPSRDRTSPGPDVGEYWGALTHEHVLTRSVRDSAAVLDATAGPMLGDLHTAVPPTRPWRSEVGADPGRLRIGLLTRRASGDPVDPECVTAATSAAALLADLGHEVDAYDGAELHDPEGMDGMSTVIAAGLAHAVVEWERLLGTPVDGLEPFPAMVVERGRSLSATDLVEAVNRMSRWSRRLAAATSAYDVVVSPTMAILPPPLGTLSGDAPLETAAPGWSAMAAFALPFDVSGQPAMSLPLHWSPDGLPVGVQFVAGPRREDVLFRLAGQLEQARPWADRRPPLSWGA